MLILANIAEEYVRAVEDHTDFVSARLSSTTSAKELELLDVVVALHEELISFIANRRIGTRWTG